ncbi:MAG: enoyl-CoA hydratase/isomerase family protein [Chloroflexi bacterium]|nr:enoyl-CoA hydratase/isomerase family protein [Chloroflexota bacterium]
MAYETLLWEKDGNVAVVTLNRPAALNALNSQMCIDLADLFCELEGDQEVNAVVITGSGQRAFMAGADIREMQPLSSPEALAFLTKVKTAFNAVEAYSRPVIAAVNGFAFGGGCELSLACDIRIAAENARFGQQEVNLGIIPGGGATQRLAPIVGLGKAKEMIYTGDPIDAQEAYRIGLVNKVVPQEALIDEAKKLAQKIAAKSPHAIKQAKLAVNHGLNMDRSSGLDYEVRAASLLWSTEEQKKLMGDFIKR